MSTTTNILGFRGWSLYTSLTVLTLLINIASHYLFKGCLFTELEIANIIRLMTKGKLPESFYESIHRSLPCLQQTECGHIALV